MKNLYLFIIIFTFITTKSFTQTYGQLDVGVNTSEAGGNYEPKNIVAIWVEDINGNFVKTLMAYANYQKTHLNTWQASTKNAGTEYNTTDAVTGATRTSHGNRQCIWNGLDYNQILMPDGTYKLWMELTDKNGTGNYSSFEFIKGIDPQNLTPSDVPSFSNISISWQPSGTGISETIINRFYKIAQQGSNGKFTVLGPEFDRIEILDISGKHISTSYNKSIDLGNERTGMYLIKISFDNQTEIHKVIR